jgi:glucokinase
MASSTALVADIGGTHMRLAAAEDGRADLSTARLYVGAEFAGPAEVALRYLEETGIARPDAACLALAGPIRSRRVPLTNSDWVVDADEFEAKTGIGTCRLINDFEALAWSLPGLGPDDLAQVGGGEARPGARAVLGPGTGLGVALLAESGGKRIAMPGEGGHVGFAPVDEHEIEILRLMTARYGRVSAERLISGPGLEVLHRVLGEIEGQSRAPLAARDIVAGALGARSGPAWETVRAFAAMFGTVAGDIAMVAGAAGGVFLAGGLSQRLQPMLAETAFRERFDAKGRLSGYVSAMPVHVITGAYAALSGAAAALVEDPTPDGPA